MKSKKILPPDEQSLLLVSLLFARKHLDEIYSFFSEAQCERMNEAKTRFLRLEQSARVTQIILELRRLLSIKENNFRWIHPSWFEHELAKEPAYLRDIIEPALYDNINNLNIDKTSPISSEQIIQNFLTPFLNSPQRVAIFDPVLMRLQSLHREHQITVITSVGHYALVALSQVLQKPRFDLFLKRNFIYLELDTKIIIGDNPLSHEYYKNILLKNLLYLRKKIHKNIFLEFGLWLIAFYLSSYKSQWHRTIEFILERSLGVSLREKIKLVSTENIKLAKAAFTRIIIDAMDSAMIV